MSTVHITLTRQEAYDAIWQLTESKKLIEYLIDGFTGLSNLDEVDLLFLYKKRLKEMKQVPSVRGPKFSHVDASIAEDYDVIFSKFKISIAED